MNEVLSVTIQEWLMANAGHACMPEGLMPDTLAADMAEAAMAVLRANFKAQAFVKKCDEAGNEIVLAIAEQVRQQTARDEEGELKL